MQNMNTYLAASTMDSIWRGFQKVQSMFAGLGKFGDILLLLLIIWVGKFVVKGIGKLLSSALSKTSLDDKIAAKLGHDANVSAGIVGFVKAIAWLFILLFALDTAHLNTVGEPIKDLLNQVMDFLPKLLLAGVFAYIVIMIAGLLKKLLADVLTATKLDERLGSAAGTTPISGALVTAAYAYFLLLFTPAILDVLGIDAVSEPIKGIVDSITSAVPKILVAGVLIGIGCLIGSIAKRLVTNLLDVTGVNTFPEKLGLSIPTTGSRSISSVAGTVVMISVIVLTLTAAIAKLDIEILTDASKGLYAGYFKVLLALLILVGGIIASRFAYDKLVAGNATLAKVAKYAILFLTTVIALNRSGLAAGLTDLPYTVAIYAAGVALGIGGAIAIGLGGQQYVARWFDKRG